MVVKLIVLLNRLHCFSVKLEILVLIHDTGEVVATSTAKVHNTLRPTVQTKGRDRVVGIGVSRWNGWAVFFYWWLQD
jgi:hypothetical protein